MSKKLQSFILILLGLYLGATDVWAQAIREPDFQSALNSVTGQIKSTSGGIINLILLISGILALGGAAIAAYDFWNGEHEAKKKLLMWLGGCVFIWGAYLITRSMFLQ